MAGMHGRIGTIPAHLTAAEATSERITVSGTVRQTAVFAENLLLRRRITSEVGSSSFTASTTP